MRKIVRSLSVPGTAGPDDAEEGFLGVFVECTECETAVLTLLRFDDQGFPYANLVTCSDH